MKLGGRFDLTYCSNIHSGERWSDVFTTLRRSLPVIRERLSASGPFAIGLRLSGQAARDLEEPRALQAFREFLSEGQFYVPTINGFPYGAFHGTRVKERVYLPDWRSEERVDYSNRLARLLSAFSRDAGATHASISTVPGAFRLALTSSHELEAMAQNILLHAACLKQLAADTGVTVALALEPEPACHLETSLDAVTFFEELLLSPSLLASASRASGVSLSVADVLSHVGVCLDACHMAVEFEDPVDAFARCRAAGIAVRKVQLSCAIRIDPSRSSESPEAILRRFAEDTYLHQVVTSHADALEKYNDLPDALAAAGHERGREWRVHFHVPIFLESMSGFDTTQSYLARVLDLLDETTASSCLEVETYTWDVLPPEYRTVDVCTAIARELDWVRSRLVR
jgi:sugar phosphate isomerase/epimerase